MHNNTYLDPDFQISKEALEWEAGEFKTSLQDLQIIAKELQVGKTPKERNPMRLIKPTMNLIEAMGYIHQVTIDNSERNKVLATLTEIAKEQNEDDPISKMLMLTVKVVGGTYNYAESRRYMREIENMF